MTLNEAIEHYDSLAEECRRKASIERNDYMDLRDESAEYSQLSEWLVELAVLREKVNCSELLNSSQTKFKPGSKFLLEIGEKRIGLNEYSIVGTDLYVWGSLLEKLTPYEPNEDTISRQDAIEALCVGCGEYSDRGCTFRKYVGGCPNYDFMTSLPSVQAEQKWIPVKKELPKDRSWNLGIFRESDTGWVNPIPFVCDYVGRETPITTKDFWIIKEHDGAIDYYRNLECVAWMPLPEYRGDAK